MIEDQQDPYADDGEAFERVAAKDPYAGEETGAFEPQPERPVHDTSSLFEPERQKAEDVYILEPFTEVSREESARRFGLGWSAGVAFIGAVAFMMFLGWLIDLLIGTGPWGVVAGIFLGGAIGFFQFFRISSRIFPKSEAPKVNPLLSSDEKQD